MMRIGPIALAIVGTFTVAQVRVGRQERPEAVATSALRAIVTAQQAYASKNGGYAPTLRALATPCSAGELGFISPNFVHEPVFVGAYEIRLVPQDRLSFRYSDCHGYRPTAAFEAAAIPRTNAAPNTPSFGVDQNGVIWTR